MFHRRQLLSAIAVSVTSAVMSPSFAQLFKYSQTEATTARYDAQRSGWTRTDHFISPARMNGFALQWKTRVKASGSNVAALSGGIVSGAGLGITLAYLGSADNRSIAIDMDNGYVFYNRSYGTPQGSSAGCLSASLATPSKPTALTPAASPNPTAAGQAKVGPNTQLPFGSVVGDPGEGIPAVKPGSYFATKGSFFGAPDAKPYDGTKESAAEGAAHVAVYKGTTGRAGPANFDGGAAPPGPAGLSNAPGPGNGGLVNAPAAAAARPGAPVAAPRANFGPRGGGPAYTLSADGMLHALTTNDGLDAQQPTPFIPSGSQASALTLVDGVMYTATSNGCGGAPNGIWAIASAATPVGTPIAKAMSWTTGGTASPHEPAFNADGRLFTTVSAGSGRVSDSVVALDSKTLEQKAIFTQAGANFVSAPVIFREDKQDIIAAQAADGRVFLLDGADLSKPLFVSPAAADAVGYIPASMATWKDAGGQRWLLTATSQSIRAWRVTGTGTTASLAEGWTLTGLKAPLAPLVINGVVFALSSGNGSAKSTAELYAVDAVTGKTLWTSGKTISTVVPASSALWSSMGQVLVGAADDTIYAFGMTMDRHL